ncbi:MAG: hypothetical protein ACFBSD_05215 [Paracoccaceae bacterium]
MLDLVLLDGSMAGLDGLAGLAAARASNGDRPVALISGIAGLGVAQEALDNGRPGPSAAFRHEFDLGARLSLRFECNGSTTLSVTTKG